MDIVAGMDRDGIQRNDFIDFIIVAIVVKMVPQTVGKLLRQAINITAYIYRSISIEMYKQVRPIPIPTVLGWTQTIQLALVHRIIGRKGIEVHSRSRLTCRIARNKSA